MNKKCNLSNVTKNYLTKFREILNKMIEGMTSAELTNSISHNFIVQMIPHHQAAIEMSKNILKYTTNIPLQNIALSIINEQKQSIENMLDVKDTCSMLSNTKCDLQLYKLKFEKITTTMFSQMENSIVTNNVNSNFIREMIPHHRGAIRMSNNALNYNICNELKPIIYKIIKSQTKGIEQMNSILRCIQ